MFYFINCAPLLNHLIIKHINCSNFYATAFLCPTVGDFDQSIDFYTLIKKHHVGVTKMLGLGVCLKLTLRTSPEEVSTPGQTQKGLGLRVYPFTTPDCCTA